MFRSSRARIAKRIALFLIWLVASSGCKDEVEPPCELRIVDPPRDPRSGSVVDVVGGAVDGTRLGVDMTYFGPASTAPSARVYVVRAGADEVASLAADFGRPGGDERDLAELRSAVASRARPKAEAEGVVWGSHLPKSLPWCRGPDGAVFVRDGEDISVFETERSKGEDGATVFSVCTRGRARCARAVLTTELTSVRLESVFRTHAAIWFGARAEHDALGIPFSSWHLAGVRVEP